MSSELRDHFITMMVYQNILVKIYLFWRMFEYISDGLLCNLFVYICRSDPLSVFLHLWKTPTILVSRSQNLFSHPWQKYDLILYYLQVLFVFFALISIEIKYHLSLPYVMSHFSKLYRVGYSYYILSLYFNIFFCIFVF